MDTIERQTKCLGNAVAMRPTALADDILLRPVMCQLFQATTQKRSNRHTHNFLECTFQFAGNLLFRRGATRFELTKGKLLLMPPKITHSWMVNDHGGLHISMMLKIEPKPGASLVFTRFLQARCKDLGYVITPPTPIRHAISLISAHIGDEKFAQDAIVSKALELFSLLLWQHLFAEPWRQVQPLPRSVSPLDYQESICRNVEGRIASIFSVPLNWNDLSKKLNLSSRQLNRIFHKRRGKSIHSYLQQVRLDHARQLLSENEMTISEIGAICGMPNTSYFCRFFHARVGMTPNQYRHSLDV